MTHFDRAEFVYRLKLPRPQKDLLLYLAHRMNLRTHSTDPSLATISKDTGMDRSSILSARAELRAKGYICWVRRLINSTQNDTTVYRITNPTLCGKPHKGVVRKTHQSTTTSSRKSHSPVPANTTGSLECGHCGKNIATDTTAVAGLCRK